MARKAKKVISEAEMEDYLKNRILKKKTTNKAIHFNKTIESGAYSTEVNDTNKYKILNILAWLLMTTKKDHFSYKNLELNDNTKLEEVLALFNEAYKNSSIKSQKGMYYYNNHISMRIILNVNSSNTEDVYETYNQYHRRISTLSKEEKIKLRELNEMKRIAEKYDVKIG